jgi:transposase
MHPQQATQLALLADSRNIDFVDDKTVYGNPGGVTLLESLAQFQAELQRRHAVDERRNAVDDRENLELRNRIRKLATVFVRRTDNFRFESSPPIP